MHRNFYKHLIKEIFLSSYHFYGSDNWDEVRFGTCPTSNSKNLFTNLSEIANNYLILPHNHDSELKRFNEINNRIDGFSNLYEYLSDDYSKNILIKLICYYIFGFRKVKLPLAETRNIEDEYNFVHSLLKSKSTICLDFNDWKLRHYSFEKVGLPYELYSFFPRRAVIFQYEYLRSNQKIRVKPEDIVIDGGGGWGDSALYFAYLAGKTGEVHTFEFVPENLSIIEKNIQLNPELGTRIKVRNHALWDSSGLDLKFNPNGPGTHIYDGMQGDKNVTTITIDNYVFNERLEKIDFIKMDIEGSELRALYGASSTIKKYKPDLAISIYHSLDDYFTIAKFIYDLDISYRLYIDHFTIHKEETVLFATCIEQSKQ